MNTKEVQQLAEALKEINHICGTVNYSSHNQMKEAIEGAVELSDAALEMYSKGKEPLIPLDDESLEDMDRDALEAAYRELRASNQKYWKGITESHARVLQLQKELEAANKGKEEVASTLGWIPFNRTTEVPKDEDFLVLFDNGEVRRYYEGQHPFAVITHIAKIPKPKEAATPTPQVTDTQATSKYHAVEYAGNWVIKTEPFYDAGVDILDAEEVGAEAAEKNAKLIASLLNNQATKATPQESLTPKQL